MTGYKNLQISFVNKTFLSTQAILIVRTDLEVDVPGWIEELDRQRLKIQLLLDLGGEGAI